MKPFDYTFNVAGKPYVLRYSFAARRQFERQENISFPAFMRLLAEPATQTADNIVKLFRMMLSTNHSDMSDVDVEVLIDQMGGEDVALKMFTDVIEDQTGGDKPNP